MQTTLLQMMYTTKCTNVYMCAQYFKILFDPALAADLSHIYQGHMLAIDGKKIFQNSNLFSELKTNMTVTETVADAGCEFSP